MRERLREGEGVLSGARGRGNYGKLMERVMTLGRRSRGSVSFIPELIVQAQSKLSSIVIPTAAKVAVCCCCCCASRPLIPNNALVFFIAACRCWGMRLGVWRWRSV